MIINPGSKLIRGFPHHNTDTYPRYPIELDYSHPALNPEYKLVVAMRAEDGYVFDYINNHRVESSLDYLECAYGPCFVNTTSVGSSIAIPSAQQLRPSPEIVSTLTIGCHYSGSSSTWAVGIGPSDNINAHIDIGGHKNDTRFLVKNDGGVGYIATQSGISCRYKSFVYVTRAGSNDEYGAGKEWAHAFRMSNGWSSSNLPGVVYTTGYYNGLITKWNLGQNTKDHRWGLVLGMLWHGALPDDVIRYINDYPWMLFKPRGI